MLEIKKAAAGIDLQALLNSAAQVPAETLAKLKELEIPYQWPTFLGIQINDLYSFFMIFVVLSAASSLILFVIYRRLARMMDEPVVAA